MAACSVSEEGVAYVSVHSNGDVIDCLFVKEVWSVCLLWRIKRVWPACVPVAVEKMWVSVSEEGVVCVL